jgi:hypothetical protein
MKGVERHFGRGLGVVDIDETVARGWIAETASQLREVADESGGSISDYACTLLASVVSDDAAAFLQIGDGAIVVSQGEEDGWAYVFWPQHGEFVNTTNFVTSAKAGDESLFELARHRVEEIAMFSDGIENLVLHKASKTVHEPFFRGVMAPVRRLPSDGVDERLSQELCAYLQSPRVCERTDDDKTLVLATRRLRASEDPKHGAQLGEQG